jgi:hypothetical protein
MLQKQKLSLLESWLQEHLQSNLQQKHQIIRVRSEHCLQNLKMRAGGMLCIPMVRVKEMVKWARSLESVSGGVETILGKCGQKI